MSWELPPSAVTKILRASMPDNFQITKDARVALSRAASVFVLYLTATSNEKAHMGKRANISAADVLEALEEMQFGEFVEPLSQFQESMKAEIAAKRAKKSTETHEEGGAIAEGHDAEEYEHAAVVDPLRDENVVEPQVKPDSMEHSASC